MPRRKSPSPSNRRLHPNSLKSAEELGRRNKELADQWRREGKPGTWNQYMAAHRKLPASASSHLPSRNPPPSQVRPLSAAPVYQSANGTSIDYSEASLLRDYLPDAIAAGSEPEPEQPLPDSEERLRAAADAVGVGESQPSVSALHAIWQSVAGTADDPYRQPGGPGWNTGAGGTNGAASGQATPAQRKIEREHAELEDAAGQWYDTGALLFSWLMWAIVGKDLGPDDQQAHSVADPLIRIALRHFDPLRKASPDAADAIAAATAFAIYMQAIWPYWMERRKEHASIRRAQQQERQRQRGAYAIPIERTPEPAVRAGPVNNGRAPDGARQAAAGGAGLRTDTADHGSGAYEQERIYSGNDGLTPEAIFTENTGYEL